MIIVTGMARSGTSLMMQILKASGISVYTDNKRKPDGNNPKGYFEIEAIGEKLKENPNFLNDKKGSVKVLSAFLEHLFKSDTKHAYIFMERNLDEIFASMGKMSGGVNAKTKDAIKEHIRIIKNKLANEKVVYINYNRLINNPNSELAKLKDFVPELDVDRSEDVIDNNLYRNIAKLN